MVLAHRRKPWRRERWVELNNNAVTASVKRKVRLLRWRTLLPSVLLKSPTWASWRSTLHEDDNVLEIDKNGEHDDVGDQSGSLPSPGWAGCSTGVQTRQQCLRLCGERHQCCILTLSLPLNISKSRFFWRRCWPASHSLTLQLWLHGILDLHSWVIILYLNRKS